MDFSNPQTTYLNRKLKTLAVGAADDAPLCTCLQYLGDNPPCPVAGHDRPASEIVRDAARECHAQPVHEGTKYGKNYRGTL